MLQTIGGLTSAKHTPPEVFALDLNCAIYHCVRKIPITYTPGERITWESRLIQEVLGYISMMVRLVAPTRTVYIAVDGVAPMAKIKQQRARRFKSAVLAEQEARIKAEARGNAYESVARWDTNAITPGTDFMRNLARALRALKLPVQTVVSPADEPGEGEQKIMSWLRSQPNTEYKNVVVYGLDADLIVLSLLEHVRSGRSVDMFREETEFGGGVKSNALGEEQFLYLHTSHLADAMYHTWGESYTSRKDFMYSYVGAMNLLGNDFIPHGMALKISDEGIETVLEILKSKQLLLVTSQTSQYNWSVIKTVFQELSAQEPQKILKGIRRKMGSRVGTSAGNSSDPEVRAMSQLNDTPIGWAAEKCLVEQRRQEGYEKFVWDFRPEWKEEYIREALWGAEENHVCEVFCKTLAWTLDYYLGQSVDMTWYYPWLLPPLFASLSTYIDGRPSITAPMQKGKPLSDVAQLAMVLPLTSMTLLPTFLQKLPQRYPHAWPASWSYFSLGRRFLWECEPLIPLIQPHQMQNWIEECLDAEE